MVTLKEIAAQAGCSPSTVSIVMRGKAEERNISSATAQRVLETAAKMGYQPNIAARSLRGGVGADELQVAMFWAEDFRAGMMVRFWDGLRQSLDQSGRPIRLAIIPYTNGHLHEMRALTGTSDFHAGIICNASNDDLDFMENTVLSIPVVLYNRTCKGYCSVNVDDSRMGALAAQALLARGCRTAAVLTGPAVFDGMEIRTQGFIHTFEARGLASPDVMICRNGISGGYERTRELITQMDEHSGTDGQSAADASLENNTSSHRSALPDGLLCGSSMIAHGAIRAFFEAGMSAGSMPRIVAIGNGMEEQDRYSAPSLSVIRMPMEDMARACLQLLLELMEGKAEPGKRVLLDTAYIRRESC